MTAHIDPVYGTAVFLIGLLLVGSIQNRRRGWKKQRQVYPSSEGLSPLWEFFEVPAREPLAHAEMPPAGPAAAEGFTVQLMQMAAGLRGNGKPVEIGLEDTKAVEVLRKPR